MEEEAEKLKEMQGEVEKQMMSTKAGDNISSPSHSTNDFDINGHLSPVCVCGRSAVSHTRGESRDGCPISICWECKFPLSDVSVHFCLRTCVCVFTLVTNCVFSLLLLLSGGLPVHCRGVRATFPGMWGHQPSHHHLRQVHWQP